MPARWAPWASPVPLYDVASGGRATATSVAAGEVGRNRASAPDERVSPAACSRGYYRDEEKTDEVWHDGMYHTGDMAWRDEDGYFWYVGRVDDVIKSSGYRIGPFEIESVIMELPYVLECGVSAAPDPVRGQVVKASIVLTKGTQGTEELKKEIQTLRQGAHRALQVSPDRGVPGRAAQDRQRQDSAQQAVKRRRAEGESFPGNDGKFRIPPRFHR